MPTTDRKAKDFFVRRRRCAASVTAPARLDLQQLVPPRQSDSQNASNSFGNVVKRCSHPLSGPSVPASQTRFHWRALLRQHHCPHADATKRVPPTTSQTATTTPDTSVRSARKHPSAAAAPPDAAPNPYGPGPTGPAAARPATRRSTPHGPGGKTSSTRPSTPAIAPEPAPVPTGPVPRTPAPGPPWRQHAAAGRTSENPPASGDNSLVIQDLRNHRPATPRPTLERTGRCSK